MMNVMKVGTAVMVGVLAGGVSLVVAQTTATGPSVKPATVATKAGAAPPASAKPTKTAGGNKLAVSTANNATDDDSFWVEKVDVDGDGDVEDTNIVWDDEDKVLFVYSVGAFACRNGGTATTELLVATNAAGNPRKKPAGSGFWLADLDKGECGAQAAACGAASSMRAATKPRAESRCWTRRTTSSPSSPPPSSLSTRSRHRPPSNEVTMRSRDLHFRVPHGRGSLGKLCYLIVSTVPPNAAGSGWW